jgi:hypothetical protein
MISILKTNNKNIKGQITKRRKVEEEEVLGKLGSGPPQ